MSEQKKKRGRPPNSKSTIKVKMEDLIELVPKGWNVEVGTSWLKRMGFEVSPSEESRVEVSPAHASPKVQEVESVDRPNRIKLQAKEL